MATGLDEDFKKPRNVTDQIVRLLDYDEVTKSDRIRLILLYILHRDGVFTTDIQRLLAHAQLPPHESYMIQNLDLLGARTTRPLRDTRPAATPLFPRKAPQQVPCEEMSLSRFEPNLKLLLEDLSRGALDQTMFPYTKPQLDSQEALAAQTGMAQSSLRAAKPTWAKGRATNANEPRQRIIVFMAGGATYSESRACYEASRLFAKDVFMTTSHMITPSLFIRQVTDLGLDRRQLDLPVDRPPVQAPAHVFEQERPPAPSQPKPQRKVSSRKDAQSSHPPTGQMMAMSMQQNGGPSGPDVLQGPRAQPGPQRPMQASAPQPPAASGARAKDEKEKKKHKFLGVKF